MRLMDYLKKTFTVPLISEDFRRNFDAVFSKTEKTDKGKEAADEAPRTESHPADSGHR